ncbi:uncharacterized protein ACN2A1_013462 isoform 5-T6 [Glossina fuscipes fuscipes]
MCRRFEGTSRGKRSKVKDVKGPPKIQIKRIVYYTDKKKMKSNSTLIASSPHIDDDSLHTKITKQEYVSTHRFSGMRLFHTPNANVRTPAHSGLRRLNVFLLVL